MNIDKVQKLISKGEGIDVEFKESRNKLNKDVYETICAFLNRNGGHLFLGVKNNGTIVGVDQNEIENILQSLLITVNNPQKLNPPSYLDAEVFDIENEKIISIFVPPSSSVHSVNGKIFDRNGDADLNITGRNAQIAKVFREIGWAEELGSGVKNLFKYSKIYGKNDPLIIEEDIFKITIPVEATPQATPQATMQATMQAEGNIRKFCNTPKTTYEIMENLNLKNRDHFRGNILKPLLEKKVLLLTILDKPSSPNQKYITNKQYKE